MICGPLDDPSRCEAPIHDLLHGDASACLTSSRRLDGYKHNIPERTDCVIREPTVVPHDAVVLYSSQTVNIVTVRTAVSALQKCSTLVRLLYSSPSP